MHELIRHPEPGVYVSTKNHLKVGGATRSKSVKLVADQGRDLVEMVLSNQDVDDLVVLLRYYQKEVFGDA